MDIHSQEAPAKGTPVRINPENISMNIPSTRAAPPKALQEAMFRERKRKLELAL
jgi:hypothetical protein